jgi:hypothetical protein
MLVQKSGLLIIGFFLSVSLLQGQIKETQCNDSIDNDGDGKIDCADPNCKKDPVCSDGPASSPDLVMFDSLDQEIGTVVDYYLGFARVVTEIDGSTILLI